MSEKRRSKRQEDREAKKSLTRRMNIGNTVITLDREKVVIKTPYRQVMYKAASMNNAYMNYALMFSDQDEKEKETYGSILVGLEMIPVYAHTDPELASKILNLFIDSVNEKINGAVVDENDDRTNDEIVDEINSELKDWVKEE